MTRLQATFTRLQNEGRTGLISYTTAGDPSLERSADVLVGLARAGADVLEVGVPFSDPVADGPEIQRAVERARAAGGTLQTALEVCRGVRQRCDAPLVVFTYVNPLLTMGLVPFATAAAAAGVDGVLVLDLPVDEADEAREILADRGLDMIFLLSPTSTDQRIAKAAALGSGFLYAISRLGVTGARETVSGDAPRLVARIRARTSLPVAVGFGVSRPEHVQEIGRWADAAVVGSSLVSVVAGVGASDDLVTRVAGYVRWLKGEPEASWSS